MFFVETLEGKNVERGDWDTKYIGYRKNIMVSDTKKLCQRYSGNKKYFCKFYYINELDDADVLQRNLEGGL